MDLTPCLDWTLAGSLVLSVDLNVDINLNFLCTTFKNSLCAEDCSVAGDCFSKGDLWGLDEDLGQDGGSTGSPVNDFALSSGQLERRFLLLLCLLMLWDGYLALFGPPSGLMATAAGQDRVSKNPLGEALAHQLALERWRLPASIEGQEGRFAFLGPSAGRMTATAGQDN